MKVLELIAERVRGKQLQRSQGYSALVADVARGAKIDADAAAGLLDAAGKTAGDLEADVELFQQRTAWRASIDSLPTLGGEERDLRAMMAEADAELEAAEKAHATKVRPLAFRLEQIAAARAEARQAEIELRRTAATTPAELAAISAELERLDAESVQLSGAKADGVNLGRAAYENQTGLVASPDNFARWLAARKEAAEAANLRLAEIEARRVELLTHREALEAQQLAVWPAAG